MTEREKQKERERGWGQKKREKQRLGEFDSTGGLSLGTLWNARHSRIPYPL